MAPLKLAHMKIAAIVGARPQFIKAAAISRAIDTHNRDNSPPVIEEILVHTGQHYDDDMSAIFFRELELPEPKYNLGIGGHDAASCPQDTRRNTACFKSFLLSLCRSLLTAKNNVVSKYQNNCGISVSSA